LCRKYVFAPPALIDAEPNCCATVPEATAMSAQRPGATTMLPSGAPEELEVDPDDDPPLDPDDVDDPAASVPDELPPAEASSPEPEEPPPPEVELEPGSPESWA